MQRDVSRGVIYAVVAVIVLAVGAGLFYVINGGFKTQSQKVYEWEHYGYPMKLARKGDLSALNSENERRKKAGEPLLVAPPVHIPDYSQDAVKRSADEIRRGAGGGPKTTP